MEILIKQLFLSSAWYAANCYCLKPSYFYLACPVKKERKTLAPYTETKNTKAREKKIPPVDSHQITTAEFSMHHSFLAACETWTEEFLQEADQRVDVTAERMSQNCLALCFIMNGRRY